MQIFSKMKMRNALGRLVGLEAAIPGQEVAIPGQDVAVPGQDVAVPSVRSPYTELSSKHIMLFR